MLMGESSWGSQNLFVGVYPKRSKNLCEGTSLVDREGKQKQLI
jgi:hypothetical protein